MTEPKARLPIGTRAFLGMKALQILHNDHGLTQGHQKLILTRFQNKEGFFMEAIELPNEYPSLQCALYGPSEGDEEVPEEEVTYVVRNNRPCCTRTVNRPTRDARYMVVIGIGDGPNGDTLKVFTAYGSIKGSISVREPGDQSMENMEEILESRKFWSGHALAQ